MLKTLSNKEKKLLIDTYDLNKNYLSKKEIITKKGSIYLINKIPTFIEIKKVEIEAENSESTNTEEKIEKKSILIPFLKNIEQNLKYFNKKFSYIKIDKGAIPYILNGADVMKPGITKIGKFNMNEVILILEENHNKTLAIGISLYNNEELKQKKNGKVVKNIHFYNDSYFKEIGTK